MSIKKGSVRDTTKKQMNNKLGSPLGTHVYVPDYKGRTEPRRELEHCFWTHCFALDIIPHPLSFYFLNIDIVFQYLVSGGQYFI